MDGGMLPQDGEVQLGTVMLPRGKRIFPADDRSDGQARPVAWVTDSSVPDPGQTWLALSDMHPQTGLVPVLIANWGSSWDVDDLVAAPEDLPDLAPLDRLDAAKVLGALWAFNETGVDEDAEESEQPARPWPTPHSSAFLGLPQPGEGAASLDEIVGAVMRVTTDPAANAELARLSELDRQEAGVVLPDRETVHAESERRRAERAARARPFPGLAPPADGGALTASEIGAALAGLPTARICLVPAPRAADVLATIGWTTFDDCYEPVPVTNSVWIGAVLRSWEDRFGARLLSIGPDAAELRLLVQRPPRTEQAAGQIAAEQCAFADECLSGLNEIPQLAPALVSAPIWRFWWD